MAIALLAADPTLSLVHISRVMLKQWPELGVIDPVLDSEGLRRAVRIGEATVSFELCGRFKHPQTLEHRAPNNHVWPQAQSLVEDYVGTVLIQVDLDDGDSGIDYSVLLSQAVYGLLKTCPAVAGVYWPAAGHVLSRDLALNHFKALPKQLPIKAWVGVWAHTDEDGRVMGFIQGLPLLGGHDFEIIDAPENADEVRGRLYGLIDYAAARGWVLDNGDTIGVDEHEKIAVHKQAAELGRSGWVFRLSYQQQSPNHPWRS